MDFSRSEYPALLESLQPGQAIAVLEDRIKQIGKVNSDIADWLQERRRLEEIYAQGLKKLASKRAYEPSLDLGIFRTPWQSVVSSTESLAQSHALLAQRIEADVERPLREFQTKGREMQAMNTIQGNLASVGKDLEVAQKKAEKVKGGKSSTKMANATSDVEMAHQQWESQAPYVFERLQALDETRVNFLRDVLTQLQTHEIDQVEKNRTNAETCLNVLLNVTTADEISNFVAKVSGRRESTSPRLKSRSTTSNVLRPVTPSRAQDDGRSEMSTVSALRSASSPSHERRFGLKRLGTVMGRRRQNSDRPPSPERRSRPNLNPLRRGTSSRDMQTIPSPEESAVSLAPSPPPQVPPLPQSKIPPPTETLRTTREQQRANEQPNGTMDLPSTTGSPSLPATNGLQHPVDPAPPQNQLSAAASEKPTVSRVDSDGFNVPPAANDEISRAQQEAASLDAEPQFKLDIRTEPIREEDGDAQSALSNVANTLRAQAQQVATPRKPSANRGRRDVRNTIFVPSPQAPEMPKFGEPPMPVATAFNASRSNTLSSEMQHNSDAQSIRSSHSMTSMMHAAIKHPDMNEPGLNASIVETVSADFSHGQVSRSTVMGELALVYRPGNSEAALGSATIRLDNFPVLEKVAPNPAFITQLPWRSGEYSVDLSHVARTSVAFKYKVHMEEPYLAAHAPVTLTPSWKIEPRQASVILTYAFNQAFASPAKRSVALHNVVVLIHLEQAKASSCLSKPVGTFSKEKSTIYWKLGDVTVDASADAPQKLIARFSTESEAKAGAVEARWEIGGEDAAGLGSGLGLSQTVGSGPEGGSDPFVDEGTLAGSEAAWQAVRVTRRVVSGRYVAV